MQTNYKVLSNNIVLEVKIRFDDLDIPYNLWFSNVTSSQYECIGLGKSASGYAVAYSRTEGKEVEPLYSNYILEENVDYVIKAVFDSTTQTKELYLNGELQKTKLYNSEMSKNTQPFLLFATRENVVLKAKIYWAKVYDNGELALHLIPCVRNHDNVVGMLDVVSLSFYHSETDNEFTGG